MLNRCLGLAPMNRIEPERTIHEDRSVVLVADHVREGMRARPRHPDPTPLPVEPTVRRVIAFVGDGALTMLMGELATCMIGRGQGVLVAPATWLG
jgi:hypothetical protein